MFSCRDQDPQAALRDFYDRVAKYESIYETINESESESSFIKVINVGAQVVANRCGGYLLSQVMK